MPVEEEAEEGGQRVAGEQGPVKQLSEAHMNSETETAITRSTQVHTRSSVDIL